MSRNGFVYDSNLRGAPQRFSQDSGSVENGRQEETYYDYHEPKPARDWMFWLGMFAAVGCIALAGLVIIGAVVNAAYHNNEESNEIVVILPNGHRKRQEIDEAWKEYVKKCNLTFTFDKRYPSSHDDDDDDDGDREHREELYRKAIFVSNYERIHRLTMGQHHTSPFSHVNSSFCQAHRTHDEFSSDFLIPPDQLADSFKQTVNSTTVLPYNVTTALQNLTATPPPASFNWCTPGPFGGEVCPPVQNQKECGSCWAFAASEALASQHFLQGNNFTLLSAQQLVSCDRVLDNGCHGGSPTSAFDYILGTTGGLVSDTAYPYTSGSLGQIDVTGTCNNALVGSTPNSANMSAWHWVSRTNPAQNSLNKGGEYPICQYTIANITRAELDMRNALFAHGPLSVCLNGDVLQHVSISNSPDMLITADHCKADYINATAYPAENADDHYTACANHCLLLVGYGKNSAGMDYWIIQNQWKTTWGNKGYGYIERGRNACGIASQASRVEAR